MKHLMLFYVHSAVTQLCARSCIILETCNNIYVQHITVDTVRRYMVYKLLA